jgi:hypothetical protein
MQHVSLRDRRGAPAASFAPDGKSLSQICKQIKLSRGSDPTLIEEHLMQDAVILWAISAGTVLGPSARWHGAARRRRRLGASAHPVDRGCPPPRCHA